VGTRDPPYRHNALSHTFYEHLPQQPEAIVTATWPGLLDAFLPCAVRHTARVLCCLVPLAYISAAPAPRRAWLGQLWKEDRVLFVHLRAVPNTGTEAPSVWLVIAATAAVR
jgi:hypothetical protein